MATRRIQPEVQKLFEKYVTNSLHVRRLEREEALQMLQNEFELRPSDAEEMMDYFDTDKNGSLSLWEFQHFYTLAGRGVSNTAAQFETLDVNKQRFLTKDEIENVLMSMKSADGQELEERDIGMLLKTARDPEKVVLGDYIALLYRLKLYRKATGR